ncbi:MAG: hypothetical protein RLZZ524_602 [Pseudomonadota bacterium]|jgi:hypothetical protein
MALTTVSDLKVSTPQIRNAYAERVAKAVNEFIAGAGAAFVINDAAVPGEYLKESFWKLPSGLVSRRITSGTGSDSSATPVTVAQDENVKVRLSRKIGPVQITDDALRKILTAPDEFGMWVGEMAAEAVLEKMIADGLMGAAAALNRSPYQADRSSLTDPTLSRAALAAGLALMGDRAGDVKVWVMHSKAYWDLVAKDMDPSTSSDALLANVALYGGSPATLGRPALVIDDSSLVIDETTDKYLTLGLTAGAIQLTADTQLTDMLVERVGGNENITTRIQGERDWFMQLKGFAWDVSNGGANPADAALATATNWDAVSTSAKDRAGVCIRTT